MRFKQSLLTVGLMLGLTTLNSHASLIAYTSGTQRLIYSDVSGVTWSGDANLLGTLEASNPNLVDTIISKVGSIVDSPNRFDTPAGSGSHTLTAEDFGANGWVTWFGAQAFTKYLNTINYAGSSQWTLPSAGTNPQWGYNQTNTQFGELFYNELGGIADENGGYHTIPTNSNFTNLKSDPYWLNEEAGMPHYILGPSAWVFYTSQGLQNPWEKDSLLYAWPVSPGQISAVPPPSAAGLFSTGMLGLLGLKRLGYAG
ncbi:hypothetical protein ACH50O_12295 [Methylomonas sp. 2BW1-5-20]|uniref:hypothetical protein n=1 Tax=Methylomonas sp. 2BW1-5-20 TaxID=3376686 RepID=UPI00404FDA1D